MSDFMPKNHHLREVSIFFFHSKKIAAEAHRELQKVYRDAALSETKEVQKPSKTLMLFIMSC